MTLRVQTTLAALTFRPCRISKTSVVEVRCLVGEFSLIKCELVEPAQYAERLAGEAMTHPLCDFPYYLRFCFIADMGGGLGASDDEEGGVSSFCCKPGMV
jgi:hypothetical protein